MPEQRADPVEWSVFVESEKDAGWRSGGQREGVGKEGERSVTPSERTGWSHCEFSGAGEANAHDLNFS